MKPNNELITQQDATTFLLLIFLNQPYMFRATDSPNLRSSFDSIHSFWYNAQTLLPTGVAVEMELIRGWVWG
jgi:hypothetical protein